MMDGAEAALVGLGVPAEPCTPSGSTWPEGPSAPRQMTRLVWLIAAPIVVACLLFAAAES